ncbi:MAG: chromosomal replication initiator protein DnaA [Gammaproteobacteria bacterium]|nr:chromosomal replication initiator protein DnaA [Gammaproteobacteria bacterium]
MSETWNDCVARLKAQISEADISAWVAPLHPVRRDDTLKLLAPNRYVLDYVRKNLFHLIEKKILEMNSGIRLVQVEIGGHGSADAVRSAGSARLAAGNRSPQPYAGGAMNDNFTFEKHVEGNSNQLARAAALQVGKNAGRAYNPLFIYGEVGLGKTHLMQAAGHLMQHTDRSAKVMYVRSELFVNDMVNALKNNAMHHFKRHYRSLSALLIDDIQFFAKKTQSQEEFFHTFNSLLEGQRQIIITSDRIPNAITNVDARLISRFSSGLTVGIEPPELETRVAILEKKALERGIELPKEVAFFVAHAIRSNVRTLTGALHRILATAGFTGRPLDVDLARDALSDLLAHQQKQISIENIQQTVAEYYKLRVTDLLSKKRSRNIARPRQLAMFLAKEYTNLSLPQIGARFGGRDHTTVLYACRRIEELIQTDPGIKEDYRNLERSFGV